MQKVSRPSPLLITVRKLLVSAAVIVIFALYVVQQRLADASSIAVELAATPVPAAISPRGIISSQVVSQPSAPATVVVSNQKYKDGAYQGSVTDAFYGTVQVEATVQGGKLTNVQFLDYPRDRRTSEQINDIAMPYLMREAIQAQSAQVDVVSGATLTSRAFIQSLGDALNQAQTTS